MSISKNIKTFILVVLALGVSLSMIGNAEAESGTAKFSAIKQGLSNTTSVTGRGSGSSVNGSDYNSAVNSANHKWDYNDNALKSKDAALQRQINSLINEVNRLKSESASSGGAGTWVYKGKRHSSPGGGLYVNGTSTVSLTTSCPVKGLGVYIEGNCHSSSSSCSSEKTWYLCQ